MDAKVTTGSKFRCSANQWNQFIDSAEWVKTQSKNYGGLYNPGTAGQGIYLVKNSSAANVGIYIPLAITDLVIKTTDPFIRESPVFDCTDWGSIAATNLRKTRTVITQEPIAAGMYGKALLFGVTKSQIDVSATADTAGWIYAQADATATTGGLFAAPFGPARIIWRETGSGTKWALLEITEFVYQNLADPTLNYYEIDRSDAADDALAWNPVADTPADWADYDGLKLTMESMRYRSGASATLEYVYQTYYWLTPFAPVIDAVTPVAATTNICPNS